MAERVRKALTLLLAADERVKCSQRALHAAAKKAYPVGSLVHWKHGEHRRERCARVVGHRDGWWCAPELNVQSLDTGKTYSLAVYRVSEHERTEGQS